MNRVYPPAQESLDRLRELMKSVRRQSDYIEALVDAPMPSGLTPNEARLAVRRFAALVEQTGPRRGLVRFGR